MTISENYKSIVSCTDGELKDMLNLHINKINHINMELNFRRTVVRMLVLKINSLYVTGINFYQLSLDCIYKK